MILGIDASQANRKIKSGTEWYAWHLIREFKKLLGGRKDIIVRLYTRDALRADLAQGLPENFEVKILSWPFKYFWVQGRLSLEMLFNPPDILFCPAHTIPLVHPTKTFTTLHDVGFEDYPELYDKLSRWYHRWSARLAVKKAYHIFTVSEFSRERIIENYSCDPAKLSVTYLGLDSRPPIAVEGKLRGNDREKKGNYILFIGRLEPKKNILGIVKGYEMAQADLLLVLAGRKVNIKDAEEYLNNRPELKKKIRFLGYFDEKDKAELLAGASIFLFPTLYEGFGLPILEAQVAGVPVITSNTASNPEIAGEGALIVDPESPYEISQAIQKLSNDENLRKELVAKGLENVRRFNWEETAKKTFDVIFADYVIPSTEPESRLDAGPSPA
ncbi:MAG: glycosyltransferase family 4 protein [Candidatus Doudnabacteria bacterium]|nr:glycosyltransferase family 4 protein [Candidatus Doudnabacteria bacterium]